MILRQRSTVVLIGLVCVSAVLLGVGGVLKRVASLIPSDYGN